MTYSKLPAVLLTENWYWTIFSDDKGLLTSPTGIKYASFNTDNRKYRLKYGKETYQFEDIKNYKELFKKIENEIMKHYIYKETEEYHIFNKHELKFLIENIKEPNYEKFNKKDLIIIIEILNEKIKEIKNEPSYKQRL